MLLLIKNRLSPTTNDADILALYLHALTKSVPYNTTLITRKSWLYSQTQRLMELKGIPINSICDAILNGNVEIPKKSVRTP